MAHRPGSLSTIGLFTLVLCTAIIGCGPAKSEFETVRLEGRVSIGNQPVAKANMQFLPEPGTRGKPDGCEVINGSYVAEKVPKGKVRVVIQAMRETGKTITDPNGTIYPEIVNVVSESQRNGIVIETTIDDLAKNFDLQSK